MVNGFLGHFLDQGPSSKVMEFGRTTRSKKNLGGSRILPFHNGGSQCTPGNIQWYSNGFIYLSRSMSQSNLIMEVYGKCLRLHGFDELWDLS